MLLFVGVVSVCGLVLLVVVGFDQRCGLFVVGCLFCVCCCWLLVLVVVGCCCCLLFGVAVRCR